MNVIAYLVYGTRAEYQLELSYAVLSAKHFIGDRPDYRIVVISDGLIRRDDLPVEQLVFDADRFAAWTRGGAYQHEAKPNALQRALETYGDKVALIDTDTYFLRHPDELFDRVGPGWSVMQDSDGLMGAQTGWRKLLGVVPGTCNGYSLAPDALVHNSGVVGMHASDTHLIGETKSLIATLHAIDPIFNIEQFAFTAVLDKHTTLTICPEVVFHYWGFWRPFIQIRIAHLFPDFTRATFDRHVVALPPATPPKRRVSDRLRAKAKALQRGHGGDYQFAYLAYLSALSSARVSRPDANVWARLALDVVRKHSFPPEHVSRDFSRFMSPRQPDWLSGDVQNGWQEYRASFAS